MNRYLRFLKTSGIYFLGNVLSKLVSLLLLPLYTNCIDPAQYGTYDLVISILNIIYPIAFFQIWDSMFRFSFDYAKDEDKYGVISNSIVVSIVGTLVFIVITIISYELYHFEYFVLVLVLGISQAICYLYSFSARVFLDNKLFVFSGCINTVVNAIVNIILIVQFNWDIKSLYFSPIVGCIFQILIIEVKVGLIRNFNIHSVSRTLIKQMLLFSIPLCIATISYWLLSGLSKVIVTNYLGSTANGMYAVANRFASMITLFVSIFQYAWNESAYLMHSEENRIEIYSKCVNIFMKVMIYCTGAAISFILIIFPYFIGDYYYDALSIIPTCIVGVAFNSMASFLATLFMTEKKTQFVLTSTLVAATVNIILAIPFTMQIGIQGTIIVLDISFFVLLLLRVIRLRKTLNITIDKSIIISVVILIMTILIFYSDKVILNGFNVIFNCVLVLISIREFISPLMKKISKK